MKIEIGKQYVRRDGKVTGKIINNPYKEDSEYIYQDENNCLTYTEDGMYNIEWSRDTHHYDLVSEYI